MDPLSDLIALLRPSAVFSKPVTGRGDWGVRYGDINRTGFAIVLEGRCELVLESHPPLSLAEGDFVLLTGAYSLSLMSRPGMECASRSPTFEPLRYGCPDGVPDFQMLAGSFEIDSANAALLFDLIPNVIHIPSSENDTGRLARVIQLIMEESLADRPGRHRAMQRLMEVLLIEMLRWVSVSREMPPLGILTGLRDPAIAKSIRLMHADVKHGWTVAELAASSGMSRSAFAMRFAEAVGCGPMEYLSRWRMSLARDALTHARLPLEQLAQAIGYQSASAFSNAFKRRTGCAPGKFSR